MTKIFAVSTGHYSDYSVLAIFSTEEKARTFMSRFDGGEFNEVEEYELDPAEVDTNLKSFFVRMNRDGDVMEARINGFVWMAFHAANGGFDINGNLIVYCFAEDEKHAAKIANEIRAQKIANNEWGI